MTRPEAWLRGPIPDMPAALQPVAYALIQALEEVESAIAGLSTTQLWRRVGGGAPIGFHIVHMAGSLDRLLTYARGESLNDRQRAALAAEREGAALGPDELLDLLRRGAEAALAQLRETDPTTLDDARSVGRAALPSTVRGLLHHAGEHTARHAGQVVTTVKIMRGPG